MGSACCKAKRRRGEVDLDVFHPKSDKWKGGPKGDSDEILIQPDSREGESSKSNLESEKPQSSEHQLGLQRKKEPKGASFRKVTSKGANVKSAMTRAKMPEVKSWSRDINELALGLYQKVAAADREGNVLFSPLSISVALALVENGADGETRDEIRRLFSRATTDRVNLLDAFGSLQSRVTQIPANSGELRMGTGWFCADEFSLKQEFVENVKTWLKTQPIKAPFGKNPEAARSQVNKSISDSTAARIPALLAPGTIDSRTACILASAAYVRLNWATSFDIRRTETRAFYRCGTDEKQFAHYMIRAGHDIPYAETRDLQLAELPYSVTSLSLYIVLPHRRDEIGEAERMKPDQLIELFQSASGASIRLEIPRFTVRLPLKLTPILEQLGLRNWKNLSRMTSDPRACISSVMHETYFKVDEKGMETAPEPRVGGSVESHFTSFFADHPFLFALVHKPTWTIVLMGKVNSVE